MQPGKYDMAWAALWFALSTLLTGIFIANKFWLYSSVDAMMLSGSIAGAKWLVQVMAALIFLKEKKAAFLRRIGFVCFTGSVLLFVYYLFNFLSLPVSGFTQFVGSIALSVAVMIAMYYKAVLATGLSLKWFLLWLACLAVAITLQATIVF